MTSLTRIAAALALSLFARDASAGALLRATFEHSVPGIGPVTAIVSTSATGSFDGSRFRLDAGGWFATTQCPPSGPVCIPGGTPAPAQFLTLFDNGAVSGTLGDATLTARPGVPGRAWIVARPFARFPAFTLLLVIPIHPGAGAHAHPFNPSPWTLSSVVGASGLARPATGHGSWEVWYDRWHLGAAATQTGLSSYFQGALPDVMATGSAALTPGGNFKLTLVSLGRVHRTEFGASSPSFRVASLSRLTLLFVPEPHAFGLIAAAAAVLALAARRARRRRGAAELSCRE